MTIDISFGTINQEDYQDEKGMWWVMSACGHYTGGGKPGENISLCPNCMFLARFQPITVVYPDRLEDKHKPQSADFEKVK